MAKYICVCSVAHSCLIHCDFMDCSPPGSSVHGISQAAYWSGLPCPTLEDLPDQRIEPAFPVSSAQAGGFFPTEPLGKPHAYLNEYWKNITHTLSPRVIIVNAEIDVKVGTSW